jgi:hypothetical protein
LIELIGTIALITETDNQFLWDGIRPPFLALKADEERPNGSFKAFCKLSATPLPKIVTSSISNWVPELISSIEQKHCEKDNKANWEITSLT